MQSKNRACTVDAGMRVAAWRRWLLFALLLLPLVALSLWYVRRTFVDVVWQDAFIHIPMIGAFLSGEGTLRDLVGPFCGEHLLFGYRALLLLNAEWFGLDMRLDPVMFIAASVTLAAIIYADFCRLFVTLRASVTLLLSAPLILLCFSLVAPPGGLMSTQFVWGSVVALLVAWLLQRDFFTQVSRQTWVTWRTAAVMALTIVYFFVFSGAYFPGFVVGVGAMALGRWLSIHRAWPARRFWLAGAPILLSVAVYFWAYSTFSTQSAGQDGASGGLGTFFTHASDTVLSYLAGIGSSLVDIHTLEPHSPWTWVALGLALVLLAVAALALYVKTKMYAKTYLPLYCMAYPVGIITMVRIGRASGGWAWMGNEWYTFHYRFFAIAVVWTLLYAGVEAVRQGWRPSRGWRSWGSWAIVLVAVCALLVGATHLVSNRKQWRRGPLVRDWLVEKRNALLFPEFFADPDAVLLSQDALISESRAILDRHDLSSFSARSLASLSTATGLSLVRFDGWSADGWIGQKALGGIIAKSGTTARFVGVAPDFIPENRVEVRINGKKVFAQVVPAGAKREFTAPVHEGMNVVMVTCQRAVSPLSAGISADERPLGFNLSVFSD